MNGYNGINHTNSDSNVLAVSLQTIFSNWLGPVWWSLASLRLLLAWLDNQDGQTALLRKSKTDSADSAYSGVITKNKEVSLHSEPGLKSIDIGNDPLSSSLINNEPAPSTDYRIGRAAHHRRPFFEHLLFQTFFTASSTLAVMLACIWLRDDPVLWTVLAPKYVNAALWAVFHQFLINDVLCTCLWSAVMR